VITPVINIDISSFPVYISLPMNPEYLRITETTELVAFFGVGPVLAITIAYLSWRGKPRRFNPGLYAITYVLSVLTGVLLLVVGKRPVDVRTAQYFLQFFCGVLGSLLLWVSIGCGFPVVLHLLSYFWSWHSRTRLRDSTVMKD
jgi:hypothetical protein